MGIIRFSHSSSDICRIPEDPLAPSKTYPKEAIFRCKTRKGKEGPRLQLMS